MWTFKVIFLNLLMVIFRDIHASDGFSTVLLTTQGFEI